MAAEPSTPSAATAAPSVGDRAFGYLLAVAATLVAFALRMALSRYLGPPYILFYPTIMVVAVLGGLGPGLVAVALSVLVSAAWVLPAEHQPLDGRDLAGLAIFAAAGALVSAVAHLYRRSRERVSALERERAVAIGLAAERERVSVTLRSIGDAVISTDRDGRVTLMNPVAEALTGWPAAEAVGRPLDEVFRLIGEDSRQPVESPVGRVLREGTVVGLAHHTSLIARDGTERPIADSGAPIRDASGRLSGVVLVFRDQTEERRAERALLASEGRLRAMVEQAAVGVCLVETATGRFLQVNQRFCEILGRSREELLAASWRDFTHPDHLAADQARVDRMAATGEAYRTEKRYLRADGSTVWAGITVSPVVVAPGEPPTAQVSVVEDITERRRSQEALAADGRRQRFLMALADAVRPLTDPLEVKAQAMRILGVELGATRVHYGEVSADGAWGVVESEYRVAGAASTEGRYHLDDYGPTVMNEFRAGRNLVIEDVATDPRLSPGERAATAGLGVGAYAIVPLLKARRPVAMLVAHQAGPRRWAAEELRLMEETAERTWSELERARTEVARRQSREELRQREEYFRALIEKSTDLVAVVGGDGRLRFWSPTAAETLGWTAEEMVERAAGELLHPEDRERVARARLEALAAPGAVVRETIRVRHRDGSWLELEATGRNLLHDPAVRGLVVNARDVTAQRALEEQLHQAQRLESIGRLAGGVAHDFNNLLTVVLAGSEALRLDLAAAPAQQLEELDAIHAAGERARDLTRQLLTFARKHVAAPQPVDLNAVVGGARTMLQRLLGEEIDLRFDLHGAPCPLVADPGQVEQVLVNLAVNARDAMPRGGVLTVETQDVAESGATPGCADGGRWSRLSIRDTGVGMSAEVQAHVFEPFFTTKEKGKGTGLGLATVYGIVSQAGGHLHVRSRPGHGTTFEACFPRVESARDGLTPSPRARARGGTETILVAEDDAQVQAVTVRALQAGGYQVVAGARPAQVLASYQDGGPRARLLVTDVVMPEMDGPSLAAALRALDPALRVLYVSGYSEGAIADRGVLRPGIDFLAKPFTREALLAKVREILDRALPHS